MKTCKILTGVLGVLLCAGLRMTASPVFAAERQLTPEQLEKLLKRYPEADADKDGKLAADEAQAYLRKLRSGRSGDVPTASAPASMNATAWQATDGKGRRVSAKRAERAGGLADLKPDHADLSYGPHPNNKLDLWLATSRQPTPLVVFIHGGGFKGGDKSTASPLAIRTCLGVRVSFAAINYRFRTELPIQDVLRDCARAIQFLRWKAEEFNVDKSRVAAFGGSAGAGASLWLAFHDDLADPRNSNPVLRESSRLSAAASSAGQATYDILKWKDVLGDETAMRFFPRSEWPSFYGLKSLDELHSPEGEKIRADVDMLGLITKDDPPVLLAASDRHDALERKGDVNHSPKHSIAIKDRCDEVGVPAVLKVGNTAPGDKASKQSPVEFLLDHLGVKAAANFDKAPYLEQLSAKGKERGYKEFVYKKTPQGELRIYFAMPVDWSPNDKRPALIFFYGGGWAGGNVFSSTWVAEHFTKRGVVVGLADYRVRKRHGVMLDKCAEDARSAVRWVRANCRNLGVDPERVIAGGGSAGGHIAACTATIDAPNSDTDDLRVSCKPNGLLLFYPVASLVDDRRAAAFKQVLGEELARKLSPARNVTKSWPPTVLFSGTADIELPNGVLFHDKAKEAGVTFDLYLEEGGGHGVVPTGPRDLSWLQYASDFFIRAGVIDKGPQPDVPPGKLRKYNGEPVDRTLIKIKRGAPGKPNRRNPRLRSEDAGKP